MGETIIVLLAFWVFIKIVEALLGGWGKSDYRRDR